MKFIRLTKQEDRKQIMVNMDLVSEVVRSPNNTYTTLVVPMAVEEKDRLVFVIEALDEIENKVTKLG